MAAREPKEVVLEILILQVFVSLLLVVGSVILFAFTCRQKTFDHADRLALLPIDDDGGHAAPVLRPSPPNTKEPKDPAS